MSITIATVNDDWASGGTNLPDVHTRADLIMAQECKYDHAVAFEGWTVHHNVSSVSKAGCLIAWKTDALQHYRRNGIFLGARHGAAKMLNRWCLWDRFRLRDDVNSRLLIIAAHRPPLRYKWLWPAFDASLAAFIRHHRGKGFEVIVGMDANSHDPQPLQRRTGLAWHHNGIDGFLVSEGIHLSNLSVLPKNTSDHHPVLATVSFVRR